MPLAPGTRLDSFEIIAPLGAGGMGEVYRARDLTLKRDVAIKVLPGSWSHNPERLHRFELEAQAAAALNHPNIVSIFHVGQHDGSPYIVTELLQGETLRERLHRGRMPLREVLKVAVAVAQGLAAAHEAGIVHRDLKPENLFLTKDGHVKILDFGLAKLTQARVAAAEGATAPLQQPTTPGYALGTVGYMSPEQVRGQAADQRADSFAFGAVLYEMLTGQRAFQKPTAAETMAAILNEEPGPIAQISGGTSPAVQRIVRRCLEKNPEQRFQSASDLAFALEALSESGISQAPTVSSERFHGRNVGMIAVTLVTVGVILASAAFFYGRFRTISTNKTSSSQSIEIKQVTHNGHALASAISPDGRYLAHVFSAGDQETLSILQLDTGSQVDLVPTKQHYDGATFSPDGNYIYYIRTAEDSTSYNDLYRIPMLGGTAAKLTHDIDTPVGFSPTGGQLAFVRGVLEKNQFQLVVAGADGQGERVLVSGPASLANESGPALFAPTWSPNGNLIAFTTYQPGQETRSALRVVSVKDGSTRLFYSSADDLGRPLWLADDSGLIVPIAEYSRHLRGQIWFIPYPSGQPRRITDDPNDYNYWSLDVNRDGTVMADPVESISADLWIAPRGDISNPKAITSDGFAETSVSWTSDNQIVYGDREGNIFRTTVSGSRRTLLNPDKNPSWMPSGCGDGEQIVFVSYRSQMAGLWAMDEKNSTVVPLHDTEYAQTPQCSPDGRWVVYSVGMNSFRQPLTGGGTPISLGSTNHWGPRISPDGKLIAYVSVFQGTSRPPKIQISRFPEGPVLYEFDWQAFINDVPRWTADSKAIQHIVTQNGISNIWEQRLSGEPPKQITNFTSGRIFDFEWSPDGKFLAFIKGTRTRDVVLIRNFR